MSLGQQGQLGKRVASKVHSVSESPRLTGATVWLRISSRMAKIKQEPLQPREFRTPEEVAAAIGKLQKRIKEVEGLDVQAAVVGQTGAVEIVRSSVRAAIRDAFGENSPEFREHMYMQIWSGAEFMNMDSGYIIQCIDRGRTKVVGFSTASSDA
jgi:hypothetical protein